MQHGQGQGDADEGYKKERRSCSRERASRDPPRVDRRHGQGVARRLRHARMAVAVAVAWVVTAGSCRSGRMGTGARTSRSLEGVN